VRITVGLYYNGARYLAAWLGRWTSADPIGLQAGLNLYQYCRGSPINYTDPSGTQDKPTTDTFDGTQSGGSGPPPRDEYAETLQEVDAGIAAERVVVKGALDRLTAAAGEAGIVRRRDYPGGGSSYGLDSGLLSSLGWSKDTQEFFLGKLRSHQLIPLGEDSPGKWASEIEPGRPIGGYGTFAEGRAATHAGQENLRQWRHELSGAALFGLAQGHAAFQATVAGAGGPPHVGTTGTISGSAVTEPGPYRMGAPAGPETFFRAMDPKHVKRLQATGRIPGTGETMTSEVEAYAQTYTAFGGVLVELTVRAGTKAALAAIGVRNDAPLAAAAHPSMPLASKGWNENHAFFKAEDGQISIGLGIGRALELFNNNLMRTDVKPKRP